MPDSSPAASEPRPPLSGRVLGRRRLLAIGAAAPVAFAIAKASGTRTAESYSGAAYYFC
jgi:hypothetical protein